MSSWYERLEYGRSIMGYVIAGVIISLFIGLIAYGIVLLVKLTATTLSTAHEIAVNTIGGEVEHTTIQVGNETLRLSKPTNPALSAIADALFKLLVVVGNVLAHPVTLAVLLAITLITSALMEKRGL
jgi:hypothetical protein